MRPHVAAPFALVSLAVATTALVAIPWLDTGRSATTDYVSDYVRGPSAPLLLTFLVAMAVATTLATLMAGAHTPTRLARAATTLILMNVASALALAVFPTDPQGTTLLTTTGAIHHSAARIGGITGILGLIFWAFAIHGAPAWRRYDAALVAAFAALALIGGIGFFGIIAVGISERLFGLGMIGFVSLIAVRSLQRVRAKPSRARARAAARSD